MRKPEEIASATAAKGGDDSDRWAMRCGVARLAQEESHQKIAALKAEVERLREIVGRKMDELEADVLKQLSSERNALRSQLQTARREALEEAARACMSPTSASRIRSLITQQESGVAGEQG